MTPPPELSAVLPTGHLHQAAWAMRALAMRAREVRLELIVLYEHGEPPPAGHPALERFARTRFIRTNTTRSAAAARALGVRAADADVVVFSEPHCFPRLGWARALVDAHAEGEWAAVGPQFECGNPGDASDAILISDYTDWVAPCERREAEHLPGHNSAYRRDALLALGEELPALLEAESVLHWRLREWGGRLLVEPAAAVGHRNFTRPRQVWPERRAVGRMFAATRARGWGWGRRLAAAAASLALPPVLIWRRVRRARQLGKGRVMVRGLPSVLVAACAQAVGEIQGYLGGLGDSPRRLALFEFSTRLEGRAVAGEAGS